MKKETVLIKLNTDLGGFKKGKTIRLPCDCEGTPLAQYWNRRLKDSKIDNCIEIVKSIKTIKHVEPIQIFKKSTKK